MAHGFGNHLKSDKYNFYSAGTKKHGLNPYAVEVMKEVGVDISHHESNTTDELPQETMDIVFTVCSDAHENCPFFPGGKVIHVGFDDPPRLTENETDEEKKREVYRRVRDEIRAFVENIEEYVGGEND
jgi:arsenate reductase